MAEHVLSKVRSPLLTCTPVQPGVNDSRAECLLPKRKVQKNGCRQSAGSSQGLARTLTSDGELTEVRAISRCGNEG